MNREKLFEYRPLVEEYLSRTASKLSSYSFVSLVAWSDFFNFTFQEIDKNLLIFAEDRAGKFLYFMPLGEHISAEAIEYAFATMKNKNGESRLSRIEHVDESAVSFFQDKKFEVRPKNPEYCYHRQDIAQLKGNAYKSQRANFNQFIKSNKYEFLPYQKNFQQQCIHLFHEWKKRKEEHSSDEMFRFMLEDNVKVHERILEYYSQLNLIGRVILMDEKIKGYTFGYPIDKETFCIDLEISDLSLKGISSFIFSRFCQDLELEPYSLINVMDDFGLDNVRMTKLAYHPVLSLPSYTVLERLK